MAQKSDNNSGFKFSPWMSIVLVLVVFFTISLLTDGLNLSNPGKTSLSKFNDFIEASHLSIVSFR
jgi:cell division protease FtsH